MTDYPGFHETIADYTRAIREDNIRKGFRPASGGPGANTFGDYIALAHSELSEALEAYRDHRLADATDADGDRIVSTGEVRPPKPEGVGSELADTMIRLMDMADVFGIDLDYEIQRKIAYNQTRPYRHGGRVLSDERGSA
jgi:NTP pyrophosphatase (non-canonical NTP hydrolase)